MAAPDLLLQGRQPLHDLAGLGLEAIAQGPHHRIALIEVGEHRGAGNGLDAADAGRHAALGHDLEQADLGGVGHMGAAAQLHRYAGHVHHPLLITIADLTGVGALPGGHCCVQTCHPAIHTAETNQSTPWVCFPALLVTTSSPAIAKLCWAQQHWLRKKTHSRVGQLIGR